MFKNVAGQKIELFAFDSATGAPKLSDAVNITVYVNKDNAGPVALGDTSATELSSTTDPGAYAFDLTQAETNADKLRFSGKSTTSGVVVVAQTIYTLPASFTAFNNPLSAAQTFAALGMASANMDAQLAAIAAQATAIVAQTLATALRSAVGLAAANTDTQLAALASAIGSVNSAVSSVPTAIQNADALLARNVAGGSDGGMIVSEALYFLRCDWNIANGVLSVKDPAGALAWQKNVASDPAANPIVSISS